MAADIFWYLIIPVAALWLAYSVGWQRGYDSGFLVGKDEGIKEGKVAGEQIGIEKGIKERLLNNIKGGKGGTGLLDEAEAKIREKFYADLTKKPEPKPAPKKSYTAYWWTGASVGGLLLIWWLASLPT